MAFDNQHTHPMIAEKATATELSTVDQYLKSKLNLEKGLVTPFPSANAQQTILYWLEAGAELEDHPMCRASNHFHNPSLPWDQSALTDDYYPALALDIRIYCTVTGWPYLFRKSAVTWATGYAAPSQSGQKSSFTFNLMKPNTWDKARDYYYKALTYVLKPGREDAFAKTFQSVGQVLHLLADMAVPAHVRNDFESHLSFIGAESPDVTKWYYNRFELYVNDHADLVEEAAKTIQKPSFSEIMLTSFWDTDQSMCLISGANPSCGLAEITYANYLSDTTITSNNPSELHAFPYPAISNTDYQICHDMAPQNELALYPGMIRPYVSRKSHGACPSITPERKADHFAAVGFGETVPTSNVALLQLRLDNSVHRTYAQELLPRTIGYSAALLDYFFRGDINLEPSTTDPSKFVIKNNSNEDMSGKYEIFYDNSSNERSLLIGFNPMPISAHNKSMLITLNEPKDAISYILVFKGKMGNEEDAVVGRVVKFAPLTITAPDRCLYGLIDGARLPQQFSKIKAKVKSFFTPEQAVQSGSLWAVAKYKRRMDYQPNLSTDPPSPGVIDPVFAYSTSAPIPITAADLEAMNNTKEFPFNFAGSPIPAGITDLYLKVVFRGTNGTPQDIIAMGWKDLGEPMHHVYWNATDAFYIEGKMYDRNTIEANQNLLDKALESGFPYIPLELDTDIAYCPDLEGVSKTHVEYKALKAGTFGRVITITEADQPEYDVFIHRKSTTPYEEMSSLFTSPTVVNQTNQNGVLQIFPVFTFRGSSLHAGSAFVNCAGACPENIVTLPWPNPPLSITPKPATFIEQ